MLRQYEGLIILTAAEKEEDVKAAMDKVQKEIEANGGRVEKVQRLDQRPYTSGNSQRTAGGYVNYLFEATPAAIAQLDAKFRLEPAVFRWLFTLVVKEKEYKPRRKPKPKTETAGARE